MSADNLTCGVKRSREGFGQTHNVFKDCIKFALDASGVVLNRQLRHTSTEALGGCVFAQRQHKARCMQCNMVVMCKLD